MRSSRGNPIQLALVLAVLAAVSAACGGSSGTLQAISDDAAAPDASGADAAAADARAGADATAADGTAPGADASSDAPVDVTVTDAPADGPQICNMVTNSAPAVLSTVADAATPPAQDGMAIASGTYFLTSATSYGGTSALCGGISVKGTAIIAATSTTAGSIDGIIDYSLGALKTTTTVHAIYGASGSSLSLTATCPTNDGGATSAQYSATPTTITVVQPAPMPVASCGTVLEVFTKQ